MDNIITPALFRHSKRAGESRTRYRSDLIPGCAAGNGAEQFAEGFGGAFGFFEGFEAFDPKRGDGFVDETFDRGERVALIGANEHVGNAVATHSAGATDPVDVVFGVVGNVEIDDVADSANVDAATDDVGGDQDGNRAVAKSAHDAIASGLGQIAVDGRNPFDARLEPLGQFVGPALGAGEDDALARLVAFEQMEQEIHLSRLIDGDVKLLNRLDRRLVAREVEFERVIHVPFRQFPNVVADGRGEKEGLAGLRSASKDAFDVGPEADVEHAVGFVENDVNDIAHEEGFSFDVVDDSSRRADDDIDALAERSQLSIDRFSAVEAADVNVATLGEFLELADDLLDQFPRGSENDGLRARAARLEHFDDGNGERRGFSRARFCLADDVVPFKGIGNQSGLDGAGVDITGVFKGLKHDTAKAHRTEPGRGFLDDSTNQTILPDLLSAN